MSDVHNIKDKKPRYRVSRKGMGGRPRKWPSVEDMQVAIDDYFDECEKAKESPTMNGLALALGYSGRKALSRLAEREGDSGEEDIDEYCLAIKKASTRVELWWEKRLGQNTQAAGAIFWLKNRDWTDKQEINTKVSGEADLIDALKKAQQAIKQGKKG